MEGTGHILHGVLLVMAVRHFWIGALIVEANMYIWVGILMATDPVRGEVLVIEAVGRIWAGALVIRATGHGWVASWLSQAGHVWGEALRTSASTWAWAGVLSDP